MHHSRPHTVPLAVLVLALSLSGYGLREKSSPAGNSVTNLYDAFGRSSEYGGKRILFDTGNNPGIFARNVKAAGVATSTIPRASLTC